MTHQDEGQTSAMLGRNPDHRQRSFFDGWGIKEWSAAISLVALAASAWAGLYYGQQSTADAVKSLAGSVVELKQQIETARVERDNEIRGLEQRVSRGEAERAVQSNKMDNMEELMRDIRSLMREGKKG